MTKLHLILALAFAVGAAFGACSGGSDGGGGTAPATENVSFTDDIQPIFNSSCASSLCHGTAESAGLNLTQGSSYDELRNVTSTSEPPKLRVAPGNAAGSYIVIKLEGNQTVGDKMPRGGSLSSAQITSIRTWIDEGAENN
jgi:hypothetical protein